MIVAGIVTVSELMKDCADALGGQHLAVVVEREARRHGGRDRRCAGRACLPIGLVRDDLEGAVGLTVSFAPSLRSAVSPALNAVGCWLATPKADDLAGTVLRAGCRG